MDKVLDYIRNEADVGELAYILEVLIDEQKKRDPQYDYIYMTLPLELEERETTILWIIKMLEQDMEWRRGIARKSHIQLVK